MHHITIEGRADGIIDKSENEENIDDSEEYITNIEADDPGHFVDMAEGYEVDYADGSVMIDEIKGVYANLDDMDGPKKVHVAQAMCYAYIYANLVSDEKTQVTSRSSSNRVSTKAVSAEKSAELIASASGNSVAEYAKQYVGYNYVYGGSGPTSFDCSGFTMYVFKQFGISLPHNAVTQSNYGAYVSKENLVPGDLVIFNDYSNTSIGHAAIYIGNGRIVHAANSNRGVTTDTILSGYYDARFVEGRRLM